MKILQFLKILLLDALGNLLRLTLFFTLMGFITACGFLLVLYAGEVMLWAIGDTPNATDPVTSTALAGVCALMVIGFGGAVIYEIARWIIKTWKSLP